MVGESVTTSTLRILETGFLDPTLKYTYLALIPKSKKPRDFFGYRQIILCNVLYKLVTKVIVNRLKPFMGEIISESQSAFVPGRLLTDCILNALATSYAISNLRGAGFGAFAIKLDVMKAYDRVK